ncbi:unnamed protein product [Rotaria sordida]|uniref:Uncharacterized protein n=1 Tax=Rotaria sordida TaxID=392033 RepID=A0A815Q4U6_9BILA|nr:unnamed protein product [Rotaria sordida]CAF4093090.1 unnamed protein product [Rotaria sordida]
MPTYSKRSSRSKLHCISWGQNAKKLGLSRDELNKILTTKPGITRVARALFQQIVPKELLQVDHWNDLDPYVLLKEKILIKFMERYYGPLQMRPRVTFIQRQERVKRKNCAHWTAHKCQISLKRMQNKVNLKRLQKRNFNHGELTDLKINDIFTYLSIDEKTNNEVAEEFDSATFDSDFENEYFGDIDEENVIHDSEDENGEDFEEKEMIEEDLCEEQILFGNEFFNMESSTMSTRDYDEIIDHRNDLHLPADKYRNSKKSMTDIQDGHVYTNILHSLENERQSKFISLTCNIDGAAVYTSSEQSMWTFTACINELKRTIRFSIENIIVLAISVGRKKPSRIIM